MRFIRTIGIALLTLIVLLQPWGSSAASDLTAPRRVSPVTTYSEMVMELHSDASRSRWVRLAAVGKSHQGRALWIVRVADPAGPVPARTTRIFVLCRQHGDEPASTEAILSLLQRIADRRYRLPPGITLYLAPMVNPDGAAADTRDNGAGVDLNRDWGVFTQPETRAVAHAVALIRPQILVDAHNWDTTDSFNENCVEVTRDPQCPLAYAALAMQKAGISGLQTHGMTITPTSYDSSADPHLAHRWFTHQDILSCLIETHSGSPEETEDFQHRQSVYIAFLEALARHYAGRNTALNTLEHLRPAAVREADLFPDIFSVRLRTERPSPARPLVLWPWAVLPYGLALFAAFFSRGRTSITGPMPVFHPARARRPVARRSKPRYRYSP
jgi:hypothetical protein